MVMNCGSISQCMCLELVQSKDMATLALHKDLAMETYSLMGLQTNMRGHFC
jgi:hypothetical protein